MRLFISIAFIFVTFCAHGITLRATSGDLSTMNSGATKEEATERVVNSINLKNELDSLDSTLSKTVINFDDPIFEECVRSSLGKKTEAITSFDLSGISSMKCSDNMNVASIFKHMSHKAKVIIETEKGAVEIELIKADGEDSINITGEGIKRTIGAGQVSCSLFWPKPFADQEHNFQPDLDQDDRPGGQTKDPYDDDAEQCVEPSSDDNDDNDDNDDDDSNTEDKAEEDEETDEDKGGYYDDYDSGYGVGATGASEDEFNAGGQGIGQVVNNGDEEELGESSGGSDQGSIKNNGIGAVINQVGDDELVSNEVSPVLKDVINSVIGNVER
jgi:hypothetical protein